MQRKSLARIGGQGTIGKHFSHSLAHRKGQSVSSQSFVPSSVLQEKIAGGSSHTPCLPFIQTVVAAPPYVWPYWTNLWKRIAFS